jgi:hypothetical protein
MPVRRALALAVASVALVLGALGPMTRGSVANVASMPLARDVLADRADQVLRKLGYVEPIADRALGSASIATTSGGRSGPARTTGGTASATAGRRRSRSGIAPVRRSSCASTCSDGRVEPTIRR